MSCHLFYLGEHLVFEIPIWPISPKTYHPHPKTVVTFFVSYVRWNNFDAQDFIVGETGFQETRVHVNRRI